MGVLHALNIDSIEKVDLAISIAKSFPSSRLMFGLVMDPDMDAASYLDAVLKLKAHADIFARPFDSSSYVLKNGQARYSRRTYRERAIDYCKTLGPHLWALEVANEIGVDNDPSWIPRGIGDCARAALEITTQFKVKSVVTYFAWSGMETWMEHQPLKPDIGGISYYPRTSDAISDEAALLALQRQLGDIPKMVSEYGGQDDSGASSAVTEIRMVEEMEAYTPPAEVTQYLGACSWNALAKWKYVSGLYQELWAGAPSPT